MKYINKYIKYFIFTILILIPLNAEAAIRFACISPAVPNTNVDCVITFDYPITSLVATLVVNEPIYHISNSTNNDFINNGGKYNLLYVSKTEAGGKQIATVKINIPKGVTASHASLSIKDITYIQGGITKTNIPLSVGIQINQPTTVTTKPVTTKPPVVTTVPSGSEKTFNIIMNPNNGESTASTQSCQTTGQNCKINLASVKVPVKNGFTYNGWGNASTCTEGNKTSYTASADTTLYACWTATAPVVPELPVVPPIIDAGPKLLLQTLTIEGQELEFSKFKQDYEIVVLFQIENLVIKATPAKLDTILELKESYALEVGDNTILITLSDKEDNKTTYTIKVKRLKEGEEIKKASSDATLKNITIKDYKIDFKSSEFDYSLKISSQTKTLDIVPILSDENAEFLVSGPEELVTGSVIKIAVKAEDGTINTYSITIEVAKGIKDYLVYIILGSVLLIGIIALIIANQSKHAKKQSNAENIKTKAPKKTRQMKSATVATPVVKTISPQEALTPSPVTPIPVQTKPVSAAPVVDSVEVL